MPGRDLKINLDSDLADRIEGEVRTGRFASVDSYLGEAAARMLEETSEIELWLRSSVVAGHREYLTDPAATIPAEKIMQRLRDRRSSS